jgi:hypothetical protein
MAMLEYGPTYELITDVITSKLNAAALNSRQTNGDSINIDS